MLDTHMYVFIDFPEANAKRIERTTRYETNRSNFNKFDEIWSSEILRKLPAIRFNFLALSYTFRIIFHKSLSIVWCHSELNFCGERKRRRKIQQRKKKKGKILILFHPPTIVFRHFSLYPLKSLYHFFFPFRHPECEGKK